MRPPYRGSDPNGPFPGCARERKPRAPICDALSGVGRVGVTSGGECPLVRMAAVRSLSGSGNVGGSVPGVFDPALTLCDPYRDRGMLADHPGGKNFRMDMSGPFGVVRAGCGDGKAQRLRTNLTINPIDLEYSDPMGQEPAYVVET
jgi:hypothetical protein